jgi:ketosteroid isomerase-like protein
VVEEFYAAYNAGDLEAIGELMDENVEYHVSQPGVYPVARAAVKGLFSRRRGAGRQQAGMHSALFMLCS